MKPKPFASLNHFTVPVTMCCVLVFSLCMGGESATRPSSERDGKRAFNRTSSRSRGDLPGFCRNGEQPKASNWESEGGARKGVHADARECNPVATGLQALCRGQAPTRADPERHPDSACRPG